MTDDEKLELEDIKEQAEVIGKLTPRDYAKLRGMKPQLVYYYIRTDVLEEERCDCGRKILDVKNTDEALATQKGKRGGNVDTRNDQQRQGSEVS